MEKAKDVTYKINMNASNEELGQNDGTTRLNAGESSESNVVIDILVGNTKEGTEAKDKRVVLADELEQGRQFLDGELGFMTDSSGKSFSFGYDKMTN